MLLLFVLLGNIYLFCRRYYFSTLRQLVSIRSALPGSSASSVACSRVRARVAAPSAPAPALAATPRP